jgi:UDP-glucuronate decarboxylase
MELADVNVLVAGGAGMIGSHLVDALLQDGDHVTVVDNFVTSQAVNLAHLAQEPRLTIVDADVSEPLPPSVTAAPFDRVYHLASPASPVDFLRRPVEIMIVNSAGTRHLLEIARRDGARFLLASTSEVYGDPQHHPQEETYWGRVNPIGPRSCYDEGKRFAESLTMTYHRMHGLDVRIARIFNTYGPRARLDDGRIIPNFCVQALTGAPLTIYGDGTQSRSLCYVADLVSGLNALMETDGCPGEVVNLGNPDERTVGQVAEVIVAATQSRSPVVHSSLPIEEPVRRQHDIRKARRLLDWQPRTDLDTGLAQTLDYFRAVLANSLS